MGRGMRQVVGFGDRSTGTGKFGGDCGSPHATSGEFAASRPLPNHFEISCSSLTVAALT